MSAHHEEQGLTPEEKLYREFMKNGDDFTKIEIYRSAAAWYLKAIGLKPGEEEPKRKLAEIREKIKKENKAIYSILAVAAMIVLIAVLLT